jgi:hypothetical protein
MTRGNLTTDRRRTDMKRILGALAATAVVLAGGVALAADSTGTGATSTSGAAVRKFQKDTFALRDELAAKRADLQDEYDKAEPNTARIAALEKDIVDLQARIGAAAQRSGVRGPRHGRGMGYGGMGYGGGPGSCGCGW